ncbi:hypothetical protein LTR62_006410 [Meristemomyces frigidus]|uniref:Uncharacterized protein n=1 Tax=Meristemomyces frigidus TaxID=1508187 RepID=A0AAN7TBQ4_9PEZI|nr:hypothetical protein LTR62_006410 [Meristemomyces frigidus]
MAPAWAVPTGSLLGLVAVGLIFFAWYFPHTLKKGTQADQNELNALPEGPEREARRAYNRKVIERFAKKRARERGEEVSDDEDDDDLEAGLRVRAQTPPAAAAAALSG